MNYNQTVKEYLNSVQTFRANRKILNEHQEIVKVWKKLREEHKYTSHEPRRILIRTYGELAKQVINADRLYRESEYFLRIYRPILYTTQAILRGRLKPEEKEILLAFLGNPKVFTELPKRLLGLVFISAKLLAEVLAKKLYEV